MPSWFEDHLACAPLGEWLLPVLGPGAQWVEHGAGTPRRLTALLRGLPRSASDVVAPAVVHTGPLHVPQSALALPGETALVIDLAWVAATAGWWALRPWRRAPARGDVARRFEWIMGLGLVDPQQWTCADPIAVVVTVARRRD